MPGITFDDPIFAAQAGAATEWGSVGGSAMVKIPVDLQLNRGASLELGIQALAKVDAQFSKFITAQVAGQVQAQARVQGQIQMPMNLFREVGFAVRLHAILEASAGIQVGIGLNVGDFMELAQSQLQLRGLPLTLFRILMEEVEIGMSLFAKVAYTAQAYANLVATATLVGDDQTDPGFNFTYGYGYGLEGGYGMRVLARAGLQDVSRYVGRTVDVLVDHVVDELIAQMAPEDQLTPALLDASRAPAKTAFRIGYELGEYIVKNDVPMTGAGAQAVALKCVEIVVEEIQRYLLRKMVEVGIDALTAFLQEQFDGVDDATWDTLKAAREKLAAKLMSMPAEPFNLGIGATAEYWNELVTDMVNLTLALASQAVPIPDETLRHLAMVWSAVQLMFVATVRLVRADASISLIALPPVVAAAAFEGEVTTQPHAILGDVIRDAVEATTGTPVSGDLTQQDLLVFLTGDAILGTVRSMAPEVDEFLEMFVDDTDAIADFARLAMTGVNAIAKDDEGNLDGTQTLEQLAYGLQLFITDKFEAIVVPVIRDAVPSHQPELLVYVDEVLLPSMHMVMDTCFDQVLKWATGTVSQKALEEALSSVLMAVIGRTMVLTGDVMMAYSQTQTVEILEALAREPGDDGPSGAIIQVPSGFPEAAAGIISPALPLSESEVADGLREFLRIAAEVSAPFPPEVRAKIRGLMYEVIAPLSPDGPANLLESLKNDLWIPNDGALLDLGGELMGQVGERLVEFSLRLLERLGEIAIEQLLEALAAAAEAVAAWVEGIAAAIEGLVASLAQIALDLLEIRGLIEDAVGDVLDGIQSLLGAMSGRRGSLQTAVVDRLVSDATAVLDENLVFLALPSGVKASARAAMRAAISSTVGAPILDPVVDAISAIGDEANDFLDDVRALDPNEGLVTGITELLTERIEDAVMAAMGGDDPGIDVGFSVSWSCPEMIYHLPTMKYPLGWWEEKPRTCSTSFSLGRFEFPISTLFSFISDAIMTASLVEERIITLANQIHGLLVEELKELAKIEEKEEIEAAKMQKETEQALTGVIVEGVTILQPAMTSVHTYSVPVAVVIEGVRPAFVFAGDDVPDRVLVYLDGELMDLDEFDAEAWAGSGSDLSDSEPFLMLGALPAADANLSTYLVTTVDTTSEPGGEGHEPSKKTKKNPYQVDATEKKRGESTVREAVRRQSSQRRLAESPRPMFRRGTVVLHGRAALGSDRETTKAMSTNDRSRFARRRDRADDGSSNAMLGTPLITKTLLPIADDLPGPGTVISATIPLATLDEGFHTLSVSVFDGAGREQRATTTFVVEAAAQPTKGGGHPEGTIPRKKPLRSEDVTPKKGNRRPLFPTKTERTERTKRAKAAIVARRKDPIATAAAVSPKTRKVFASRYPERDFVPVPEVEIEITATAPSARPIRERPEPVGDDAGTKAGGSKGKNKKNKDKKQGKGAKS